jgi:hexosaminidase
MRTIALVISLAFSTVIYSQLNIIPQPAEVIMGTGTHSFKTPLQIVYDEAAKKSAEFLSEYLEKFYRVQTDLSPSSATNRDAYYITLMTGPVEHEGSYELKIDKNLSITGDPAGVFYGVQTLLQLFPPHISNNLIQLPYLTIKDHPRFGYRGLHLDVARHFMPIDFIKKYIDYIAYHKMNYFHWHLTEDQGWRIEIKKYPNLTRVGGWRNGTIRGRYPGSGSDNTKHGGYYTQEEIKEIVKYAADRYIIVVPEIEMPGHSSAAIAAYPYLSCFPAESTKIPGNMISDASKNAKGKLVQETWGVFEDVFCAGNDSTFQFLQNVLDEVVALFPGKYVHVGGDECPKANWKRCPMCQQRIKDNRLKDEHQLQSYFIHRMEKYLNSKGKTLIGWDEILEGGLAPNAIVMSWQGEKGGIEAAKQKHEVIMTPLDNVYLNLSQSENEDSLVFGGYLPVDKVYNYEPIPAALSQEESKYVLGAQANIWTEYMNNPTIVEYMLFPRFSALSEVLWSAKEKKNWVSFEKRLSTQFERYELWGASYSKAYFDLKATILPNAKNDGVLWKVESKQPSGEIKYIAHYAGRPYELKFKEGITYTSPVPVKSTQLLAAISMANGKALGYPVYQKFVFNKATGKKITLKDPASKNFPGNGAFTLVDGVQNEKGGARPNEFLGFQGTDCETTIDLGKTEKVSNVVVHCIRHTVRSIWQPLTVEVFVSNNGTEFTSAGLTDDFIIKIRGLETGTMKVEFSPKNGRFIKVVVKNWGEIPAGNPGAGTKAWLLVDEIEINPPTP